MRSSRSRPPKAGLAAGRYAKGSGFKLLFALFGAAQSAKGGADAPPQKPAWLPPGTDEPFGRVAKGLRIIAENPTDRTLGLGAEGLEQFERDFSALFQSIGVPVEYAVRFGRSGVSAALEAVR